MKLLSNIRNDILGGITTSVVALPLAIAFGVAALAPLGPEYVAQGALAGLYATIIAGALAGLFGGTPAQISIATAPMSVLVTSVIVRAMQDPALTALDVDPAEVILLLVAATIVLGGVLQLLLALLGGGRLIKYIPYPVVAGFMNGIAVIIFLSQVRPFFGVDKSTSIAAILNGDAVLRYETVVVGLVTIATIVLARRFIRAVPAALVGLVFGILAYVVIGVTASPGLLQFTGNSLIVGAIPSAIPTPTQLFTFLRIVGDIPASLWLSILVPALTLSVLASIDTLLTSVVSDIVTKTRHNSRQELFGQGIGNIASAMFGGLPAAGSTAVTMVNVNAGGRTPLAAVVNSVVVLLVVLALGGLVQWIPMSVLAGILIVTAVGMVDYESLNLIKKKSAFENLFIVAVVTVITVSIDLMVAVGIGLVIASLLFVRDQLRRTIVRRRYTGDMVHSKRVRDQDAMQLLADNGAKIVVYELSGSLFFGTCDKLQTEVEKDLERLCIILDLKRVDTIDLTGAQVMRQIVDRAQEKGNHLVLAHVNGSGDKDKERIQRFLADIGVLEAVGEQHVFEDTDRALEWAEETLIDHITLERQVSSAMRVLRDLSVFKSLSDAQLQIVQPFLVPRSFKEGDIVFNEGDPGDGMYFILNGYVSILADSVDGDRTRRLATFAAGVFFGDMAVLEGKPRSATVRAETNSELLFLSNDGFHQLTEQEPLVASQMLLGIARELSYRLRVTTAEVRALEE